MTGGSGQMVVAGFEREESGEGGGGGGGGWRDGGGVDEGVGEEGVEH